MESKLLKIRTKETEEKLAREHKNSWYVIDLELTKKSCFLDCEIIQIAIYRVTDEAKIKPVMTGKYFRPKKASTQEALNVHRVSFDFLKK